MDLAFASCKDRSDQTSSLISTLICFLLYEWAAPMPRRFEEGNGCSSRRPVWLTPLKLCFFGGAKSRPLSIVPIFTLFTQRRTLCFNDARGATELFEAGVWCIAIRCLDCQALLLIFPVDILALNRSFMAVLEIYWKASHKCRHQMFGLSRFQHFSSSFLYILSMSPALNRSFVAVLEIYWQASHKYTLYRWQKYNKSWKTNTYMWEPGTQNRKVEANMLLDNLMEFMWEEGKFFLDAISDHPGIIFVALVIAFFLLLQRVGICYRFFLLQKLKIFQGEHQHPLPRGRDGGKRGDDGGKRGGAPEHKLEQQFQNIKCQI